MAQISEGLTANNAGTSIKVTDEYTESELNVPGLSQYSTAVITIDATEYTSELNIIGNYQNNVISVGSGGGQVDGGSGADKIYLADGSDVILYSTGRGRDSVYNYDGESGDVISIGSATVTPYDFTPATNGSTYLVLGTDTLAFINPTTQFFVQTDEDNFDFNLAGMTFTPNRQSVSLDADYPETEFDAANYSRLVSIEASSIEGALDINGNSNNNMITVAAGGKFGSAKAPT